MFSRLSRGTGSLLLYTNTHPWPNAPTGQQLDISSDIFGARPPPSPLGLSVRDPHRSRYQEFWLKRCKNLYFYRRLKYCFIDENKNIKPAEKIKKKCQLCLWLLLNSKPSLLTKMLIYNKFYSEIPTVTRVSSAAGVLLRHKICRPHQEDPGDHRVGLRHRQVQRLHR